MPTFICVLKRGRDLCFLHQNEVKFARERNKSRFVPHAYAQEAQCKHKIRLRSPIVNHNDLTSVKIDIYASYDLLLQSVAHWFKRYADLCINRSSVFLLLGHNFK